MIQALTAATRPDSLISYARSPRAKELLSRIGRRELDLTHESFDALPQSTSLGHLRALLVHHGALPTRGNEPVVRFKSWLKDRLDVLPDDGTRAAIERFATWHHLRRIRDRERNNEGNLETITHAAKQEITEAGKFLLWARAEHGLSPDGVRQVHVDEYLSTGPTTRRHIRNFLHTRESGATKRSRQLDVPYPVAQTNPMVTQEQRLKMVRNCIEFEQVVTSTRVAGLILLLWAQPVNRIVMLTQRDVELQVNGMYLRLGQTPALVPDALAETFGVYFRNPNNQQTGNTGTEWLFPGLRAGRHLHPATLSERLKVLGIDVQRARNATLQDLTRKLDARSLIDLLGYSGKIITMHAARSGAPMSDYVGLRLSDTQDDRRNKQPASD